MTVIKNIFSFRDKTQNIKSSSGVYFNEFNGLRCMAIIIVMLSHTYGYFIAKSPIKEFHDHVSSPLQKSLFYAGHLGVNYFFILSGFLVAFYFKRNIEKNNRFEIKHFYLRRFLRIFPPYFICMLFFFCVLIFKGKYSFTELWPHLLSSLSYLHNMIYEKNSLINGVAWTLEIEMRFYLFSPLLCTIFFLKAKARKFVFTFLLLLILCLQWSIQFNSKYLIDHLQYFWVGMLLTEFIDIEIKKHKELFFLIGLIAVAASFYIGKPTSFLEHLVLPLFMGFFCYIIHQSNTWRKLFSLKAFTIIGIVSYSFYLLHYPLISFIGPSLVELQNPNYFILSFLLQTLILFLCSLIVAGVYYVLIEKPAKKISQHFLHKR